MFDRRTLKKLNLSLLIQVELIDEHKSKSFVFSAPQQAKAGQGAERDRLLL